MVDHRDRLLAGRHHRVLAPRGDRDRIIGREHSNIAEREAKRAGEIAVLGEVEDPIGGPPLRSRRLNGNKQGCHRSQGDQ